MYSDADKKVEEELVKLFEENNWQEVMLPHSSGATMWVEPYAWHKTPIESKEDVAVWIWSCDTYNASFPMEDNLLDIAHVFNTLPERILDWKSEEGNLRNKLDYISGHTKEQWDLAWNVFSDATNDDLFDPHDLDTLADVAYKNRIPIGVAKDAWRLMDTSITAADMYKSLYGYRPNDNFAFAPAKAELENKLFDGLYVSEYAAAFIDEYEEKTPLDVFINNGYDDGSRGFYF